MAAQQPTKGLQLDTRPLEQPEGTYPFAKNGVQYDLKGATRNEEGFLKMGTTTPYRINGVIETDKFPILFSTDNEFSAIGYFNTTDDRYEPIVDDATKPYKLGFSTEKWITGQAQRNYKGEMVIAFTDKNKFPKFLNCDKPSVTSLQDFNLFPMYREPELALTLQSGGRLPQGTYYAAAKYQRTDGTTTGYSRVSDGLTVPGDGTDTITSSAIQISLTALDQSYDTVVVAIISRIKGITNTVELEPIQISNAAASVTFTGDNITEVSTLEEVLTPAARYNRVGTIGQLNDALYITDLESEPDILDMQSFANQVQVSWVSELYDAINPPQEHYTGEKKGFMHEEVYAMYIRYKKTAGGMTNAFPIPGTAPTSDQRLPSASAISGGWATPPPSFRVDDLIPSFNLSTKSGAFSPWENEERYPDEAAFDTLRDQKVRHHKFPSIRWCKENLYASEPEYGKTKLDILGIVVSNIIIPDKYIGLISGYEILYAKRTVGNMTVIGQGQLLHGTVTKGEVSKTTGNVDIFTSGGNWGTAVYHKADSSFNNNQELALRTNTFRFHAFDMLLNKPAIKADYISCQLAQRRNNLREGFVEDGNDNSNLECATVHLVDYTEKSVMVAPIASRRLRKVNTSFYATNGINANRFINVRHETCFAGTLDGTAWPVANGGDMGYYNHELYKYEPHSTFVNSTPDVEETFLVNMKVLRESPYSGLLSQSLVSAGNVNNLNTSAPIFGGDTFVSDYTFHTYGRHSGDDYRGITPPDRGKKVVRRFVCESVSNIHLRYEIPGNQYSKWYPKTAIGMENSLNDYPLYWDRNIDPNQFGYNKDLNALNDLTNATIYSPYKEYLTKFPFRIHRGGKLSRQSKIRSWRTFLPLDYYEMQKNMGYPIHLEGMEDKLLIHCQNALFLTQDKAKLESGLLAVTLGAGDIFQFEPQEAESSKLGYAGTRHELACIKTPIGYIFVDAPTGEIFLFKGGLLPLNDGLSSFFRKYLNVEGVNVFTGNGITIGWDPKYRRVMLTVKNKRNAPGVPVKVFSDTLEFWDNLVVNDVVLYKGRYIQYDGKDTDTITWQPSSPVCEKTTTCPTGYALNPDGTLCTKVEEIAATPRSGSGTPGVAAQASSASWNNVGAQLFLPGYGSDGEGLIDVYMREPHTWLNGTSLGAGQNTIDSRMNAAGIWSSTPTPDNEKIGFARKIFTPVAKVVYIGMSADNAFSFKLNGAPMVSVTSGNVTGGYNFNFWNIYPVQLLSGDNYIEMFAWNFGAAAGFAAEIYDCTREQLLAVVTVPDLEQYILFSTKNIVGQPFDLGDTQGWSCPLTYALYENAGTYTCRRPISVAPALGNSGIKSFGSRDRYKNGTYDGYSEPNNHGGTGPYIDPVTDTVACPL